MGVGYLIGGSDRRDDRARRRGGHEPVQPTGTRTGWCCRCTAPRRSTRAPRPTSTGWCRSWRAAPACRCRASTSSTIRSRMRSRPAAIRRTRRSRSPPACCNMLSREEVAGVIAHELAHIKNRDTLIMTITATIAGAISMLAQFGMFFARQPRQQQRHRHDRHARDGDPCADRRHAGADGDQPHARIRGRPLGAEIVGEPRYLASALAKLEQGRAAIPNEQAENNPATAHMFIVNPLSGGQRWTTCSRRIPRPRTASRRSSSSPPRWAVAATALAASPCGDCSARAMGRQRRGPWG